MNIIYTAIINHRQKIQKKQQQKVIITYSAMDGKTFLQSPHSIVATLHWLLLLNQYHHGHANLPLPSVGC